ncbi:MAG: cobyrinate a,c-diamide synthase [Desulfovibrio sp.]|jgi:cobyrinic acid a,c-diamide synthase|nr:cobyrinate a,c-diamide synthase [Desulfovibrio sp.]
MLIPRLLVSGLAGGAGKTMFSLGLARAFRRSGLAVRAFKKGPDYIDAAWLALAARAPRANLDPFFTPADVLLDLFRERCIACDLALIEGNRGLFDGLDANGSCSSAEVARILKAPVLLVLDCTKMTRTVAALVRGCLNFEPDVNIAGVVLNRIGNKRHGEMTKRAVEDLAGVPVLGILPRLLRPIILERHMGLAGIDELAQADSVLDELADLMEEHLDLPAIRRVASAAPPLPARKRAAAPPHPDPENLRRSLPVPERDRSRAKKERPRIGYAFDAAIWFYYQENLEALEKAGAQLVQLSLFAPPPKGRLDGLYLGGGLPELHAARLSASPMPAYVAGLARAGLPIYAECGGFMYLARSLVLEGLSYPMAGVFPFCVEFCDRPQGLGYVEAEVIGDNPYHPKGALLRGHEFHFSRCLPPDPQAGVDPDRKAVLRLNKGRGMGEEGQIQPPDGLLFNNTFAAYMHIYAPALPHWAPTFVDLCRRERDVSLP